MRPTFFLKNKNKNNIVDFLEYKNSQNNKTKFMEFNDVITITI